MGVKSTIYLTREEAEERFIKFRLSAARELAKSVVAALPNSVLEDTLEDWNDAARGGEGFENYIITKR